MTYKVGDVFRVVRGESLYAGKLMELREYPKGSSQVALYGLDEPTDNKQHHTWNAWHYVSDINAITEKEFSHITNGQMDYFVMESYMEENKSFYVRLGNQAEFSCLENLARHKGFRWSEEGATWKNGCAVQFNRKYCPHYFMYLVSNDSYMDGEEKSLGEFVDWVRQSRHEPITVCGHEVIVDPNGDVTIGGITVSSETFDKIVTKRLKVTQCVN